MAWAQAHRSGAPAERVRRLAERLVAHRRRRDGRRSSEPRTASTLLDPRARRHRARGARARRARPRGGRAVDHRRSGSTRSSVPTGSPSPTSRRRWSARSRRAPRRVVCVVGLAGAGKTTATQAVGQVFAEAGIAVLGAAPSGVAAEKLQDETGIPSTTLHRLLDDARAGGGLPPGLVLVVDEAGMAETRVLAPVLDLVEQAGGKAVLIGDPQQLPAVGAGGLFAGIVEREGAIVLTENRRQHDALERDALERVRAGVGRDYLAYAEKRERLVVSEIPSTTRARLLADWWEQARDDLAGNVMLALRRRDVADLNQFARSLMDADGRLGKERLTVADREFAAGDRVVCLRNSDRPRRQERDARNRRAGRPRQPDRDPRHRPRPAGRAQPPVPRGWQRPPRLRHHRPRRTRPHRRARLRPRLRGGAAAGMGATSRSRAPEPRPASTSPAPRASTRATSTTSTTATHSPASAARSRSPPIEELAVDQHPLPSGPRHDARPEIERSDLSADERTRRRLLDQKRRALTKTLETAERKLEKAELDFTRCSPLRRRVRNELRTEIAVQRRAIVVTQERLAETRLQIEDARLRPVSSSREIETGQRSTRTRARERGLVLER